MLFLLVSIFVMVMESSVGSAEEHIDEAKVQELLGRLTEDGRVYAAICEEPEDVLILQASYKGDFTYKIAQRLGNNLQNTGSHSTEPRPKSGKGL